MAIKDKAARNEYQKNLMRERRAREKRGKPASEKAATVRTKAVRSVTTSRKTYEGPVDLVARLEAFDTLSLELGEQLLDKAREAIDFIDTEQLGILDIKRLVEVGFKLRDKGASGLEKQEEKTEQAIFVTTEVINDPAALDAAHALLAYSAADDLARYVDGSAARPADSRILRAIHESTGVDPVPPPSSP